MPNISLGVAERLVTDALCSKIPEEQAAWTAREIITTSLEVDTRIDALSEFCKDLRLWEQRAFPMPTVVHRTSTARTYDFGGSPGQIHLRAVTLEAAKLAMSDGIGVIAIRNTGGIHELRTWVRGLAADGYVALFAWNGGSYTVVPYGSREPFFGTNPLAFGIPSLPHPIVADFATSQIPFMDLMRSIRDGSELPVGSGLDESGQPTRTPREVYDVNADTDVRLLPMGGGPKGSAVVLLLEVLTGALVGAKMGREATDDPFTPEEFGGLLIAMHPDRLFGSDDFETHVQRLANDIRSSGPAAHTKAIFVPGDLASERRARGLTRDTIELADGDRETLEAIARKPSLPS